MSNSNCYHCGDLVLGHGYFLKDLQFCCNGCKNVYELLSSNNLGNYYTMENGAGIKPSEDTTHKYNFLDVESIRKKMIDFQDENTTRITLYLPQIHCSSCIYLLENIQKIEPAIYQCHINFAKREATLSYDHRTLELSIVASLLDKIGYAPNFGNKQKNDSKTNRIFLYKLGVAGFAFGNIMLWSFPEYLGIEGDSPEFRDFSSYLSLIVSIPVLLYSASDYFVSAYRALRIKSLNLDVPITIGIIALYLQSSFSIISGNGPGYMDSFSGFIFFLLIGKWFQNKTYKMLSFERDYTSYFPVAVNRVNNEVTEIIEIDNLEVGDEIIIRNEEVIPCDSVLISDDARIDYSFVTGESETIHKKRGESIYAGGKLIGTPIKLKVEKESNRSHLTQLWNEVKNYKSQKKNRLYQDKLSYYFLIVQFIIAFLASMVWFFIDPAQISKIVVSILIVACPCALALSAPFTFGNVMRLLGRKGLYLKNTAVIERLNEVTDIVFDKTGTLTENMAQETLFSGDILSTNEKEFICSLANSSTHPLSREIVRILNTEGIESNKDVQNYKELSGKGISAQIDGHKILLGSAQFVGESTTINETAVYVSFDGQIKGYFVFKSKLREGLTQLFKNLDDFNIHVLSGDSSKDSKTISSLLPENSPALFGQSPKDKHDYILKLKEKGAKVLMIGDGLNDSGALGIADVGIAVSEDVFRFTPSCDAIIMANQLTQLNKMIAISKFSKTILKACLCFSLLYNIIGLSYAISGNLTPLIAAILMPISSVTVVCISTFLVLLKK